ncbi:MAG: hypothetical protein O3C20_23780 [Verrucomicrobia bacterium]|nr:hypothetical protein [Verrucomicrobiota bacterium]
MMTQTSLLNRTGSPKYRLSLTRLFVASCSLICSLVVQHRQASAQVVTIEVEKGVTQDIDGNTITFTDTNFIFLTPDEKAVFAGGPIPQGGGEGSTNVIYTSLAGEPPVPVFEALRSGGGVAYISNGDAVSSGQRHLGYFDRDENVFSVNVDTGESIAQGERCFEILDVSEDGRALYFKSGDDGDDRVMLGDTEILKMDGFFGEYSVSDPGESDVSINAAGDTFINLYTTTRNEDNIRINILIKNGSVVDSGLIDWAIPYIEGGYLLYTKDDTLLINGTELVNAARVNTKNFVINPNGDFYFHGAEFGIYFYDAGAEGEKTSLILDRNQRELSDWFAPLALTSRGDLVVVNTGSLSLHLLKADSGDLVTFLEAGDLVNDRTISSLSFSVGDLVENIHFNNDQLIVEGNFEDSTSRVIFRIDIYGSAAPVYTVSELCPEEPASAPETGEQLYPDPFMASDPIQLNEGPCGGDWHKRIWKDTGTGKDIPGYTPGIPGNENVIVDTQDVNLAITQGPISLRALNITGSIEVNKPLTLEENSSVENLILNSSLSIGATFTHTYIGETGTASSDLTNSVIMGNGIFNNEGGINLIQSELNTHLINRGFFTSSNSAINGAVENKVSFSLTGEENQSIHSPLFTNDGTFIKTDISECSLTGAFHNNGMVLLTEGNTHFNDFLNNGEIKITGGSHRMTGDIDFEFGDIDISKEANLEISNDLRVLTDFKVSGRGTLKFSHAEVHLDAGTLINMEVDNFQITNETVIDGEGELDIQGYMEVIDSTVKSNFTNSNGINLVNSSVSGDVLNYFTLGLENSSFSGSVDSSGLIFLDKGMASFKGDLYLRGSEQNPSEIKAMFDTNINIEGTVDVATHAHFTGEGAISLIGSAVNIPDGSELRNSTDLLGEGLTFKKNSVLLGTGVAGNVSEVGRFINFGKVHFQSGVIDGIIVSNPDGVGAVTFFFEDAPDEVDEMRVINGHFLNSRLVEQSAVVQLDTKAVVRNSGIWTLWEDAKLEYSSNSEGQVFENQPDGTLLKSGAGNAIVDVPFNNNGNVSVNGGTLIMERGALLNTDKNLVNVTLRNGSKIHLKGMEDIFTYDIAGPTTISSGDGVGKLIIDAPIKVSGSELMIVADSEWRSGDININDGSIKIVADSEWRSGDINTRMGESKLELLTRRPKSKSLANKDPLVEKTVAC